jgi:DNA-binding transcriptional MerR regulator
MSSEMKIGQVASVAGVSRDTIRYYERLNLLPRASRTRAGYRIYTEADIERLRFIKQAQAFGFLLSEIKQLLPGREVGLAECRRVRDLLESKLKEMDARLAQLRAFRRALAAYLEECERALSGKAGEGCPVLFEISHPTGKRRAFASDSEKGAFKMSRLAMTARAHKLNSSARKKGDNK